MFRRRSYSGFLARDISGIKLVIDFTLDLEKGSYLDQYLWISEPLSNSIEASSGSDTTKLFDPYTYTVLFRPARTMTSENDVNVLILGAGPVGLALALDLGRRGVRSTILERNLGPANELVAKASVLNERTMEFLRLLGLRDEVVNAGFPADLPGDTVFCTSLSGKYIGRLQMPSTEDRELPEQCCETLQRCPQFLFDPLLARAVTQRGVADLRYGVEFIGLEQDETGVNCTVRNINNGEEEQIRASYVVGCDGPTSPVRNALGISWEGQNLGFTISAILRIDNLAGQHSLGAGERYLFIGPDGTWGNFTTIDGRSLWRFSVVGLGEKVDPAKLDIDSLVLKALGRDDIKYEVLKVSQWRRSQFTAGKYCEGRVFLAGDAAHTMSPTGGHGLNTGIGDVMDLSWILHALLGGWGGPRLFEAYNTERRPIALRNGAGSTRNFGIWTDKVGRDKVLDTGVEADEQRRALGERMAGNLREEFQALGLALAYNYDASPIIVPDGTPAPLDDPSIYVQTARPGHRAPHCWLEDGSSTIDLFKGGDFVLLRFGAESSDDAKLKDAADKIRLPFHEVTITEPQVMELYQHRLVLARPDGMVAWRGDSVPDNVEGLLDQVRGMSNCNAEYGSGTP
jgi:2-polyprenyl-6-methoxyphenol hydroxylase-like FAD-dependent oxidoreductase